MIMTGLQDWNMKIQKTKTRITVKEIKKTKIIYKAEIMKVKIKMII